MINDVIVTPLVKIPDERGTILHMMRCDKEPFNKFGEIYFSTVFPGIVKGWHRHKIMTLNYAVIRGSIKFVLYDSRQDSSTFGNIMELYPGDNNYCLITVPPMIWNGFMGVGIKVAIVANLTDIPHDPNEIERCDPYDNSISYDWKVKHK